MLRLKFQMSGSRAKMEKLFELTISGAKFFR